VGVALVAIDELTQDVKLSHFLCSLVISWLCLDRLLTDEVAPEIPPDLG
jgi:hypothetical protein